MATGTCCGRCHLVDSSEVNPLVEVGRLADLLPTTLVVEADPKVPVWAGVAMATSEASSASTKMKYTFIVLPHTG